MSGTTAGMGTMDSKRGLMASSAGRKDSRCSGKSTFGTNSTAMWYADDHDVEAQNHSNSFFGVTRFGQKGHSTTLVCKNLGEDGIEMQYGVRIQTDYQVERFAPEPADGGESALHRIRGGWRWLGGRSEALLVIGGGGLRVIDSGAL